MNYVAVERSNGWVVREKHSQTTIYDGDADGDPLTEQEAKDLAWAWSNGALCDTHAVRMVIRRDGKRPAWLSAKVAKGFMSALKVSATEDRIAFTELGF